MQDSYKGSIPSNKFNHYHILLVSQWGVFPIEVGQDVEGAVKWLDDTTFMTCEGFAVKTISRYTLSGLTTKEWVRINLHSACVKGSNTPAYVADFSDEVWDKLAGQLILNYTEMPESKDEAVVESASYQHWNDRDA